MIVITSSQHSLIQPEIDRIKGSLGVKRKAEEGKSISVNEELCMFVCLPNVVIYELRANSSLSNL